MPAICLSMSFMELDDNVWHCYINLYSFHIYSQFRIFKNILRLTFFYLSIEVHYNGFHILIFRISRAFWPPPQDLCISSSLIWIMFKSLYFYFYHHNWIWDNECPIVCFPSFPLSSASLSFGYWLTHPL